MGFFQTGASGNYVKVTANEFPKGHEAIVHLS